MNCSYQISEAEAVKAMQLHGRGSRSTLITFGVIGVVLVIIGVMTEYSLIAFGAIIGGIVGYFVTLIFVISFNAKKQYRQNRALRNEISMEVTDRGVSFRSESGESWLSWDDIHKWKFRDGMFLLYITSNMFHMVPSRALQNEQFLVSTLNEKIGPKKI